MCVVTADTKDDRNSSSNNSSNNNNMNNFASLLPQSRMEAMVKRWIDDDLPSFDVGGLVVGDAQREAVLWMKSPGVFAGKPFFEAVFRQLGCEIEWTDAAVEGVYLDPMMMMPTEAKSSSSSSSSDGKSGGENKLKLASVRGAVHNILRGERTALNIISRCSGVASASLAAVSAARELHWNGWVAGTRKTTPGGFRLVEKYGLLVGGAATHRLDLSQMVMLKDNHIWSAGSIASAVALARKAAGFSQKIEVECQSLDEALEAAHAGADIVMLDNFEPSQLRRDAAALKAKYPHVLIEASGGITTETMKEYLCEHVDIVSQGKLTQGYACIDFSLKIMR